MANPVTTDDVAARWRPLTSAEDEVAEALLGDAWAILNLRIPTLDADVTAGTVTTELVVAVESAMVLRVMRNPEGKRQESIDDYSYTRDNSVAAGGLYVSADELSLLQVSGTLSGAFTITPFGETYTAYPGTTVWPEWTDLP